MTVDRSAFVDDSGETRFAGTIQPGVGTTAGDVLTSQGDGLAAQWAAGGGGIPSGSGSPVGTVTPSGIGALYLDDTVGALYIAVGSTSADWRAIGGNGVDPDTFAAPIGVTEDAAGQTTVIAKNNQAVVVSDQDGFQNSGNGIYWFAGAADGDQYAQISVGGSPSAVFGPALGLVVFNSLPTADPVNAGQLWCDTASGDVLKVSQG